MSDILNIGGEPIFDERIVRIETHTYNPYANTTFGYSDEIRIPIQHQDLYTLPCESFLYIEGKINGVKKKRIMMYLRRYCKTIASPSCLTSFDTNSTVLRLIAI